MKVIIKIGRLTIVDFTILEIEDEVPDPDVVVVHHVPDEDGPEDLFGKGH